MVFLSIFVGITKWKFGDVYQTTRSKDVRHVIDESRI